MMDIQIIALSVVSEIGYIYITVGLRFHRQQYPLLDRRGVCQKVQNKYLKLNITLCSAKTI